MSGLQKRFVFLSVLALIGVYLPAILSILEFKIPYLSLAADLSQLGAYVSIVGLLCFLILFFVNSLKNNKLYIVSCLILIVFFSIYQPLFNRVLFVPTASLHENIEPKLKVASANLYFENNRMDKAIEWTLSNTPDVISFIEVSKFQTDKLTEELIKTYPYSYISKTQGAFGIAVYSKSQLNNPQFYYDNEMDEPFFNGVWVDDNLSINIGVMHPMLPIPHSNLIKRDLRITELAEIQNKSGVSSLLMGDFNATKTSTSFRSISKKFNYEVAPTSSLFSVVPFSILIDHILLDGGNIVFVSSGHDNIEYADHYVVWAELGLK